MGFFSDLKEDLSQAVSELTPEEAKVEEGVEEAKEDIDLNALLDNIDETPAPEVEDEASKKTKATNETAVVTAGMSVTGDIVSTGSLEVIGSIKGNVTINGKLSISGAIDGDSKAAEIFAENARITGEVNSNGSVKIGQSTVIIGNIFATSAVIAGAVKGDIDVKGPVVLDTSAIVMGNIKSKSVQINNGAVIEGVCSQCYADVSPTSFFDEFKKNKK